METIRTGLLISCIYAVLVFWGSNFLEKKREASLVQKSHKGVFFVVLCLWLILEGVFAYISPGHVQDTGLFRAWASFAENHSVRQYYETDLYVDYPPVYLYVLYSIGSVAELFGISQSSGLYLLCIRSVPILFDGLGALFIYFLATKHLGEKEGVVLGLLCLFNPAHITNSALWGQVDSVVALLSAVMILSLYEKHHVISFGLLALLFLTKPQTIIFAPLLCFVSFFDFVSACRFGERKKAIKTLFLSVFAVTGILLLVPWGIIGFDFGLLAKQYTHALGLYPYATLNAPNLYGLFGGNWAEEGKIFLFFSYKTWGFIFIVLLSVFTGLVAYKAKDRRKVFYLAILMVLGIFCLGHGMHERYLHSVFLLLLILYIFTKDKAYLFLYGGFSLTYTVTCNWVLSQNLKHDFIYGDNPGFIFLSALNLVLFALFLWHASRRKSRKVTLPNIKETPGPYTLPEQGEKVHITKKDVASILVIMVFCAFVGFFRLGSLSTPQIGYYAETSGETVVLDLGEEQAVERVYVFTGWVDRRTSDQEVIRHLAVEVSSNGKDWMPCAKPLVLDQVFSWQVYRGFDVSFRYLKFTADDGRFYINEMAFYGENETAYFPVKALYSVNETANCLIDEQKSVPYTFSWYDSTYFDEIYHPRTAYEMMTGRYPYENTHPPLGKLLIALGVYLFGMTPFGWRFSGTLCGVLMVPVFYIFAKKICKKSRYGIFASFLLSFDCMHLCQTRLATIDSYTVFFVLLMYFFMYVYMERNPLVNGMKRAIVPLFLSGLFFGLAISVKWQGLYGGIGLCFLFFLTLFRGYTAYKRAKHYPLSLEAQKVTQAFWPWVYKTVLCGFLFFVLVPGVVYFLSYIPAMMTEKTGLSFFFENQVSMFSYHANLKAGHPYGSTFWQWLFDYKPLYAYSPNRDFVEEGRAMGITLFGNPLIWWTAIPTVIWAFYRLWKQDKNNGLIACLTGFLSMYVPWMFVERTTFIYHFFPCVVFVMLLLTYGLCGWEEKDKRVRLWANVYLIVTALVFFAYYPVLTGLEIPGMYARLLRFIPGWVFG